MHIITKNGEIDYDMMLKDITRQEQRWQKTLDSLSNSSELLIIAQQQLQALKRMKKVCQNELKVRK